MSLRNGCVCGRYTIVRVGFWQNGFFRGFLFLGRRIFSRILSPDFSHFCGKKCPEKSSRKIPGKILQNLYNKIPDTFLQRGRANNCANVVISWLLACNLLQFGGRSEIFFGLLMMARWRSVISQSLMLGTTLEFFTANVLA